MHACGQCRVQAWCEGSLMSAMSEKLGLSGTIGMYFSLTIIATSCGSALANIE